MCLCSCFRKLLKRMSVSVWLFQELVGTATQGIAVGIALAFVVITLATKNIITGLLATLNIGVVTLSVVGLIPMIGWKLGVRTLFLA